MSNDTGQVELMRSPGNRGVGAFTKGLLLKNRVSDNVGSVKHFLGVPTHALRRARHFALVEGLPYQPRLARNRFRSGTQSDPCISSVTTSIMITSSNSPVKGSGIPTQ
jgi:hypothetical protein